MIYLGGREPLVIPDASQHPVTKDLPITKSGNIGSYLGVPILLADGTMFGTLCALNSEPYDFTQDEQGIMTHLSKFLSHALDLEQLAANFQLKSMALEATPNAVAIVTIDGDITWVNPAFTELTGYEARELPTYRMLVPDDNPEDKATFHQIRTAVNNGSPWSGEVLTRRKDGTRYDSELTVTPVLDEAGNVRYFVSIQRDITTRKQTETRLHFLAHYDTLTQLPNRVLFQERLTEALSCDDQDALPALLFVNLDRFKNINDTLGHHIGDLLLIEAAKRIKDCAGPRAFVSRISGDEFTVLLPGPFDSLTVEQLAERLIQSIKQPMLVDDYELFISASIGISTATRQIDPDTLFQQADLALSHAKESGRNRCRFYTDDMDNSGRIEMENALRKAVDRGELILHYQPKVDLATGKMVGMEALVRWEHPTKGQIPPYVFIPLAEEIGMIGPIGEWVLREACRQNKQWQDQGLPALCVAVNLSVSQFQYGNIVEQVKAALADTGLDAEWLELEITESIIIQDTEKVISTLRDLQMMGIRIAIDDFGTGYSSLSYLKKLPIDSLKIDRSFVKDITGELEEEETIAKAVISLAQSLKLRVVAEGVETEAQLHFLMCQNCDMMQGYYFSRPLPVEEFAQLLASGRDLFAGVRVNA
ncbi:EAL domain-containing protein [Tumebacillus sp. DT12]|uniref:EAL domain-containing protein n=1 Tax=Tumebacillus lacus TaxID=2995335 RepID=A0ABT3WVI8_9BACL|nr:EAL domain-containing protein [Tumebacillus lacus]MCX7568680.1 EAL domain-containing protein [Tumebacillus lacus]